MGKVNAALLALAHRRLGAEARAAARLAEAWDLIRREGAPSRHWAERVAPELLIAEAAAGGPPPGPGGP